MVDEPAPDGPAPDGPERIRLDRWLWHARFFKTRSLATREIQAGHLRLNGVKVGKPAQLVGPGDTLTFVKADQPRVIRILAPGTRRGPAPEAQTLFDDLSPPPEPRTSRAPAFDGGGRPTKKDRRMLDQSRRRQLE